MNDALDHVDVARQLRALADAIERAPRRAVAADPLGAVERAAIAEEVASVLRHDLRNNFASIRNAAFYLARRTRGTELWTSDPRIERFFGLIEEVIGSSMKTLDERLALQHLFQRRLARVSVKGCVERAVAATRADPSLVLHVEAAEAVVEIDPAEAALAIRCLVENAAEATDGRGPVTISARAVDERVVVAVTDGGPGVPEAEREALFEAFQTRKSGHAGIGLNIARRIAARGGGDVTLQPGAGGACFELTLPLCKHPPTEGGSEA